MAWKCRPRNCQDLDFLSRTWQYRGHFGAFGRCGTKEIPQVAWKHWKMWDQKGRAECYQSNHTSKDDSRKDLLGESLTWYHTSCNLAISCSTVSSSSPVAGLYFFTNAGRRLAKYFYCTFYLLGIAEDKNKTASELFLYLSTIRNVVGRTVNRWESTWNT